MRIGELASRVGLTTSAIRFYERAGLVSDVIRDTSGYRDYGAEAAARLSFIARAKEIGFSLREIGALLESDQQSVAAVDALVARKLNDVDAQVRTLQLIRTRLQHLRRSLAHRRQG